MRARSTPAATKARMAAPTPDSVGGSRNATRRITVLGLFVANSAATRPGVVTDEPRRSTPFPSSDMRIVPPSPTPIRRTHAVPTGGMLGVLAESQSWSLLALWERSKERTALSKSTTQATVPSMSAENSPPASLRDPLYTHRSRVGSPLSATRSNSRAGTTLAAGPSPNRTETVTASPVGGITACVFSS